MVLSSRRCCDQGKSPDGFRLLLVFRVVLGQSSPQGGCLVHSAETGQGGEVVEDWWPWEDVVEEGGGGRGNVGPGDEGGGAEAEDGRQKERCQDKE